VENSTFFNPPSTQILILLLQKFDNKTFLGLGTNEAQNLATPEQ